MPIQTQRFQPLRRQHYKLATTQNELDAENARKIALQNNETRNAALLQNNRQANINNRQTQAIKATQLADDKTASINAEQENYKRGLNAEQQNYKRGLNDKVLARDIEQRAYNRSQDILNNARKDKANAITASYNKEKLGLAKERQANDNYKTDQQRKEDARDEAIRVKKEVYKNKTLAAGQLGQILSDANKNESYSVDDKGNKWIDVSPAKDTMGYLFPNHKWKGKILSLIGNDGLVTYKDDNGIALDRETNQPLRTKNNYLQMANKFYTAEEERLMVEAMRGGGDTKKSRQARKDVYKKYQDYSKDHERNMKILMEMEDSGKFDKAALKSQLEIVNELAQKAKGFYDQASGAVQVKSNELNLSSGRASIDTPKLVHKDPPRYKGLQQGGGLSPTSTLQGQLELSGQKISDLSPRDMSEYIRSLQLKAILARNERINNSIKSGISTMKRGLSRAKEGSGGRNRVRNRN